MANHAEVLMDATFAALDRIPETVRWFADELGVEKCEFLRDEGPMVVVRWLGEERRMDPRRVFANPTDARIEHEILADKAEYRASDSSTEEAP